MESKIAIICYFYAIEISPFLKNICSYLYEKGYGTIDIIVDDLYRDNSFCLPGARIVNVKEELTKIGIPSESIKQNQKLLFEHFLEANISAYTLLFCVDFWSLDILRRVGRDLSSVIFLSMEGIDYIKRYEEKYAESLILKCAFCISQSRKRGDIIKQHLNTDIDFEYIPISLRPIENKERTSCDVVDIVYSGYFADWACIPEILELYRNSKSYDFSNLLLHGHSMGTELYLKRIQELITFMPNTRIDTTFYDEKAYTQFLLNFDVGIAFYKDLTGTQNFSDLLTASGKIAYYLWHGLGVLTNIRCEETQNVPFILIDDSPMQMRQGLLKLREQRKLFRDEAYAFALNKYNFDLYMDKIAKRIFRDARFNSLPKTSYIQ